MEHDPTVPAGGAATSGQSCISIDELLAMGSGGLPPERVEVVLEHVDRCATCAEVIAHLGSLEQAPRNERYQIGRLLGAGAMGIVYEAWDVQLRRRVALKLLRPERADEDAHARMLREARALARVSHPNVVTVYDAQEADGRICIATELVDGETLATWQLERTPAEIIDAWLQAARGLAAAHAVGVVHRDIKPANVLVGRDGRVRVGDFGLARLGADDPQRPAPSPSPPPRQSGASVVSMPGTVAGTPAYMAPEQAGGVVEARSDQYALCVALAEALTGERPAPDAVPAIDDPEVRAVLARGLRGDPAQRFPTTDALVEALTAATAPPRPRRWPLVVAGGLAALALAGGAVWLVAAPAQMCELATPPRTLWPVERRAAVVRDFGEAVAARVDVWLGSWTATAADVCSDLHADPALRLRRRRCLDDAALRMDLALARLAKGTPAMQMHIGLEDLPQPVQCSADLLVHVADPTAAQEIRFAPIHARVIAGGSQDHAELARWLARARAIGYSPYIVELIEPIINIEPLAQGTQTLRDVAADAERAGDDVSWLAASCQLLPRLEGSEIDLLAGAMRARIAKLGGTRELETAFDVCLGVAMQKQKRYAEEIAAFDHALPMLRAYYGPVSMYEALLTYMVSIAHRSLEGSSSRNAVTLWVRAAAMYRKLGVPEPPMMALEDDPKKRVAQLEEMVAAAAAQTPESENVSSMENALSGALVLAADLPGALVHAQRSVAIREHLGLRDATLGTTLARIAELEAQMYHPERALEPARRAVEIAEALGDDEVRLAALSSRGRALLETGDPVAARPLLERAMALGEQQRDPPAARGNRRFLLARATWTVDRKQALELAHAARSDLESAIAILKPDSPFRAWRRGEIADIDQWLAAHH